MASDFGDIARDVPIVHSLRHSEGTCRYAHKCTHPSQHTLLWGTAAWHTALVAVHYGLFRMAVSSLALNALVRSRVS